MLKLLEELLEILQILGVLDLILGSSIKAKMDGNLGDLLPKKFSSRRDSNCETPLPGKLKFEAEAGTISGMAGMEPSAQTMAMGALLSNQIGQVESLIL